MSMFGTRGKFILVVGDEGAVLCQVHGRNVTRRLFATSPADADRIREVLESRPRRSVTLMIDVLDMALHRESLPSLAPWEIHLVLRRRIRQAFANCPTDVLQDVVVEVGQHVEPDLVRLERIGIQAKFQRFQPPADVGHLPPPDADYTRAKAYAQPPAGDAQTHRPHRQPDGGGDWLVVESAGFGHGARQGARIGVLGVPTWARGIMVARRRADAAGPRPLTIRQHPSWPKI